VRTGVGAVFGPGFHAYDVQQFAGSQTWQIRQAYVPVQPELVLGFAPYPEALSPRCEGRSYAGTSSSSSSSSGSSRICNWHWAPYFGLGVLGQTAFSVSSLTSFHVGIEVEFAQNFSVAATLAAKRTPVLADGYSAGSPVPVSPNADAFTVSGWRPGFGLFINATPSFFQFPLGSGH
jgi:hypothetical protein